VSLSAAEETARWEEERRVSRYAEGLPQLEAGLGRWGRQIPSDPALWVCDETGVKENLWLNLSTGFIGSGRQVYAKPPPHASLGLLANNLRVHVPLLHDSHQVSLIASQRCCCLSCRPTVLHTCNMVMC
jgi:hypothetical protein